MSARMAYALAGVLVIALGMTMVLGARHIIRGNRQSVVRALGDRWADVLYPRNLVPASVIWNRVCGVIVVGMGIACLVWASTN